MLPLLRVIDSRLLQRWCVAAVLAVGGGCQAHASASAQMSTTGQVEDDRKYEGAESEPPAPPAGKPPAPAPAPAQPAQKPTDRTYFLGVAHDLSLSPAATQSPACRCLAVAYGSPSDPKFVWQSGVPEVDPGTMAVAITAEGVACSAPGYAPQRASISGVERSGADIVVVVENVKAGRPTVHGALIVAPPAGGALVVRARRGAPYGAPASGGRGPCRIAVQ
jgi:hypothetical protein